MYLHWSKYDSSSKCILSLQISCAQNIHAKNNFNYKISNISQIFFYYKIIIIQKQNILLTFTT